MNKIIIDGCSWIMNLHTKTWLCWSVKAEFSVVEEVKEESIQQNVIGWYNLSNINTFKEPKCLC